MAHKKGYSRYFIILQQDENGYSVSSDKLPSGYTKLETKSDKCKITYYVQNIKKELEPYYMVLICNKKDTKKIINLGEMNIDEHGRAEITYEYNTSNIAGTNLPIDVVTGAAIVKQDGSNLISVMSGFASADPPSDWRSFQLINENRKESISEERVEKAEKIEGKSEESNKQDNILEKSLEQNKVFEEYERKIEELKQLQDNKEESEAVKAEEILEPTEEVKESASQNIEEVIKEEKVRQEIEEKIKKEIEEKVRQEIEERVKKEIEEKVREELKEKISQNENVKTDTSKVEENTEIKGDLDRSEEIKDEQRALEEKVNEEIEYPLGTVGDFFRKLAQDFEEVDGICTEIKRCKWYRVNVESLQDMNAVEDYNKYTIIYYPMTSYYQYISKYKHYLLGYKYDKDGNMKYIVYGIPGTRNIYDQPYGGKTGFVTWVSENEGDTRGEQLGYWLMFYDFKSSAVVVPVRK